jgi:hypothetical protein
MPIYRLLSFLKDPKIILALILSVFFLKGVFLTTIQPIFGGQDEARHYNTVQYLAEPKDAVSKTEKIQKKNDWDTREKDDFKTYNFSEEIQKTAGATNTDVLRGDSFNTIIFSDSFDGKNESEINAKTWKPYNYYSEPDIAGVGDSLYHKTASQIERFFANQNILVRFYLIRIFSVFLGTLAVFFCYLTAKTIGFSTKASLILTTVLSFQPKFSLYFTNINYDVLLIPMFFLFTYAGALALKKGLDWKNFALLLGSMTVAILTKPTGYILAVIFITLITYLLYEKVKLQNKRFRYSIYGACLFAFLFVAYYLYSHFLVSNASLGKTIGSIIDYISRNITFGKFIMPSDTYWGTLSWVNSWTLANVTNLIFVIETIAIIGLAILLFSKKFSQNYPAFLPTRKYILFLIGMIVALQLGIRTADWNVFSQIGGMKMSLGTPGRYFLPNLSAHIILIFTGLGAILAYFKKDQYFETVLLASLILMFSLTTYLTFDAIILRFYF